MLGVFFFKMWRDPRDTQRGASGACENVYETGGREYTVHGGEKERERERETRVTRFGRI